MAKRIITIFLILLLLSPVIYIDLLIYGVRQGIGQLRVINNSIPISSYLEKPGISDSIRTKLLLIGEIKTFAVEKLGVKSGENYTTYFDQKGKPILWNVSGAEPFELVAYEWSFPFLGSFSYKGYFNYELALKEEAHLKSKGLDTRVREVAGWSTLGWFNDPVLSGMLSRTEGDLAEVIIHELVHGTLYVKDSVDFNENLATFFGRKGAELFLIDKYGGSSNLLRTYLQNESDSEKYIEHMINGIYKLDSLYSSFRPESDFKEKNNKKNLLISEIINSLDTISFNDPARFRNYFEKLPNNSYFMAILRYRSKLGLFEEELSKNFNGNLKNYLNDLKNKYSSL
jgi:predicted aminopeptidase